MTTHQFALASPCTSRLNAYTCLRSRKLRERSKWFSKVFGEKAFLNRNISSLSVRGLCWFLKPSKKQTCRKTSQAWFFVIFERTLCNWSFTGLCSQTLKTQKRIIFPTQTTNVILFPETSLSHTFQQIGPTKVALPAWAQSIRGKNRRMSASRTSLVFFPHKTWQMVPFSLNYSGFARISVSARSWSFSEDLRSNQKYFFWGLLISSLPTRFEVIISFHFHTSPEFRFFTLTPNPKHPNGSNKLLFQSLWFAASSKF